MNLFTRPPALEFLESLRRNKQFNRSHVVDAIYVVCWIFLGITVYVFSSRDRRSVFPEDTNR